MVRDGWRMFDASIRKVTGGPNTTRPAPRSNGAPACAVIVADSSAIGRSIETSFRASNRSGTANAPPNSCGAASAKSRACSHAILICSLPARSSNSTRKGRSALLSNLALPVTETKVSPTLTVVSVNTTSGAAITAVRSWSRLGMSRILASRVSVALAAKCC